MPNYDLKCTVCRYEEEVILPIMRDLDNEPLGCINPNDKRCSGLMQKVYLKAPYVHPTATPSKTKQDSTTYSVS